MRVYLWLLARLLSVLLLEPFACIALFPLDALAGIKVAPPPAIVLWEIVLTMSGDRSLQLREGRYRC